MCIRDRDPSAFADLSTSRALGRWPQYGQGEDEAKLDDIALPLAAVHELGYPGNDVLGSNAGDRPLPAGLFGVLRHPVLANRAF